MKTRLSAVIITLNEEHNIQACLESVSFCDDIVIVDSGSQDKTLEIAKTLGARTISREWQGYGSQKQYAVEQAKYDWVLCIDADERISEVLKKTIQALPLSDKPINNQASGYLIPRRNHFLGKPLNYGEGYPDLSLRLFNRTKGQWSDDKVHEGVKLRDQEVVVILKGDILHYSQESLNKYIQKQNHYTSLQAEQLFQQGKRYSPSKCFTSPLIRFIKFYCLRLGFLDGLPGFIHITIGCFNAFSKYAKLEELHRNTRTLEKH